MGEVTMTGLYGKNVYTELRDRQQAEYNAFPKGCAFNDKQFELMMSKWGLTTSDEDCKKIVGIGCGVYLRKSDREAFYGMMKRFADEIDAMKDDEDYWYYAFVTEMYEHEYSYTMDLEDTLDALGLTWDGVFNNMTLYAAYLKARQHVIGF